MGSDARLAPNETAESVCNETYALSLPLLDNKQPGALPESVASRSVRVCASNKPNHSNPARLHCLRQCAEWSARLCHRWQAPYRS